MPSKSILRKKLENAKKKVTIIDGPEYNINKTIERQSIHPIKGGFTTYEYEEFEEEEMEFISLSSKMLNVGTEEIAAELVKTLSIICNRLKMESFFKIMCSSLNNKKKISASLIGKKLKAAIKGRQKLGFEAIKSNLKAISGVKDGLLRMSCLISGFNRVIKLSVFGNIKENFHLKNRGKGKNLKLQILLSTLEKYCSRIKEVYKIIGFTSLLRRSEICGLREEWRILENRNKMKVNSEKDAYERMRIEFEKREMLKFEERLMTRLAEEKEKWITENTGRIRLLSSNSNYNHTSSFCKMLEMCIFKKIKRKTFENLKFYSWNKKSKSNVASDSEFQLDKSNKAELKLKKMAGFFGILRNLYNGKERKTIKTQSINSLFSMLIRLQMNSKSNSFFRILSSQLKFFNQPISSPKITFEKGISVSKANNLTFAKNIIDFTFHNAELEPKTLAAYDELFLTNGKEDNSVSSIHTRVNSQCKPRDAYTTPREHRKLLISNLNTPSSYFLANHDICKTDFCKGGISPLERIKSQSAQEDETPDKRRFVYKSHKSNKSHENLKSTLTMPTQPANHRRNKTALLFTEDHEISSIDILPLQKKVKEIQDSLDSIQSRVLRSFKGPSYQENTFNEEILDKQSLMNFYKNLSGNKKIDKISIPKTYEKPEKDGSINGRNLIKGFHELNKNLKKFADRIPSSACNEDYFNKSTGKFKDELKDALNDLPTKVKEMRKRIFEERIPKFHKKVLSCYQISSSIHYCRQFDKRDKRNQIHLFREFNQTLANKKSNESR